MKEILNSGVLWRKRARKKGIQKEFWGFKRGLIDRGVKPQKKSGEKDSYKGGDFEKKGSKIQR